LAQEAGRSRDDVVRWADRLYSDHVDHKDADGFAAAFTQDGTLRFGNSDTLVGRDAIRGAIAQFFAAFKSLRHHSGRTWMDGDIVVLEAVVTYIRQDGQEVTVPAVTIFHLVPTNISSAPLADECRIYVDLTPLFAP
jgi:ketosteroid isomerase-like protein